MDPSIRRAGLDDLDRLAPLIDAYRQFYLDAAAQFARGGLQG